MADNLIYILTASATSVLLVLPSINASSTMRLAEEYAPISTLPSSTTFTISTTASSSPSSFSLSSATGGSTTETPEKEIRTLESVTIGGDYSAGDAKDDTHTSCCGTVEMQGDTGIETSFPGRTRKTAFGGSKNGRVPGRIKDEEEEEEEAEEEEPNRKGRDLGHDGLVSDQHKGRGSVAQGGGGGGGSGIAAGGGGGGGAEGGPAGGEGEGGLYTGPYFAKAQALNVTVHRGSYAKLPCTVRQLQDKIVSWVRKRDADILTVGRYTFVSDKRFSVEVSSDSETWALVIRNVGDEDEGLYECQISTEPKRSLRFALQVMVPEVKIVGGPLKYVKEGSSATLECRVMSLTQLPDFIFWYHSGWRVLEDDHPRIKIREWRRGGQGSEMNVTSQLSIREVKAGDEGNYTCLPSNLHSSSTSLHILTGEHPSAMQTVAGSPPPATPISLLLLLALVLLQVALAVNQSSLPLPRGAAFEETVAAFQRPFSLEDNVQHRRDPPSIKNIQDCSKFRDLQERVGSFQKQGSSKSRPIGRSYHKLKKEFFGHRTISKDFLSSGFSKMYEEG